MKIVIGVDAERHYQNALNLAHRFHFAHPEWILLHSVEVTVPMAGFTYPAEISFGAEFARLAMESGEATLTDAVQFAKTCGVEGEPVLVTGAAAGTLSHYANTNEVDLAVVQSTRKGTLGSLFLGSVSRALTTGGRCSVLVSKGKIDREGPVHAVFATDHSSYSERALDNFLMMKPEGLERVTVLHALDVKGAIAKSDVSWVNCHVNDMKHLTGVVSRRFAKVGIEADAKFVDGPVQESIRTTMESTKADVLVIGAQGHGFIHNALLGSTAVHQVAAEAYPVLVVRAAS